MWSLENKPEDCSRGFDFIGRGARPGVEEAAGGSLLPVDEPGTNRRPSGRVINSGRFSQKSPSTLALQQPAASSPANCGAIDISGCVENDLLEPPSELCSTRHTISEASNGSLEPADNVPQRGQESEN